jgi:epoxyqueuosine reductase QueG
MGNRGNQEFMADLQELAKDDDPVVAEHAEWAIKKLGDK